MSEIRKIHPIDAEKRVKAVSAKTPEKQELSRRITPVMDLLRGMAYVRSPWAWTTDEAGLPMRVPVICQQVSRFEMRYQRADEDRPLWCVPAKQAERVPKRCELVKLDFGDLDKNLERYQDALARKDEHEVQKMLWETGLSLGIWDEWFEPKATKARGLQSPIHTHRVFYDPFDTDYDPLSEDSNWTDLREGAYLRANAGKAWNKAAPSQKFCRYLWTPGASSANHSVGAVTLDNKDNGKIKSPRVMVRAFYVADCGPNTHGKDRIRKRRGDETYDVLVSQSTSASGAVTVRLQADDTTLKYFQGAVELTATDQTDYQSETDCGIEMYLSAGSAADLAYLDDVSVYEAAGGGGPFRTGPFREGPFKRGAFR
jgi:hypothetical protein